MSFFKKTFRSFLGLSDWENQGPIKSHSRRRNIPSPSDGLYLIPVSAGIQTPVNILQSVTVKSVAASADARNEDPGEIYDDHKPAAAMSVTNRSVWAEHLSEGSANRNEDSGEISTGDDHKSAAVTSVTNRSVWAELLSETGANRIELHTECLESESLIKRINGGSLTVEIPYSWLPERLRSRTTMARTRREKVKRKDFPPVLSSLNKNGRPRFNLKPVREDGRLKITKVLNDRPRVVRNRRLDGRLRMKLVCSNQNDDEEEKTATSSCDDEDEAEEREDGGGGGCGRATWAMW